MPIIERNGDVVITDVAGKELFAFHGDSSMTWRQTNTKMRINKQTGDLESLLPNMENWARVSDTSWGYVSPSRFGMYDPTGVLDSTKAITAAINSGYPVSLGDGEFMIRSPLPVPSGLKIKGNGMGRTILLPYGSRYSAFYQIGSAASPLHDIEIRDMKIDGTNFGDTTYSGTTKAIFLQYVQRLRIIGVYAYNTPATGIGPDFLQDSLIQGCIAEKCGRLDTALHAGGNGIGVGTGMLNAVENVIISNCHARANGNNGIMFEVQDEDTGAVQAGYMQVENCTAIGNGDAGFRNSGSMRIRWVGNLALSNSGDGFMVTSGYNGPSSTIFGKEDIIANNHAYYNGQNGINLGASPPDAIERISGNHVAYNTQGGIYSEFAVNKVSVNDNFVYNNGHNGIRFQGGGSNIDIADNTVFNNGQSNTAGYQHGISVYAPQSGINFSNVSIHDNEVFDDQATKTQMRGISVFSASTGTVAHALVDGNNMHDNGTSNFYTAGSGVTDLRVRNNPGYNPVGPSTVAVGASPFTYTAGVSPETVYINGGTVSSITKNGVTLVAGSPAQVQMEPNDSIVVTYSVAPTIAKDVH